MFIKPSSLLSKISKIYYVFSLCNVKPVPHTNNCEVRHWTFTKHSPSNSKQSIILLAHRFSAQTKSVWLFFAVYLSLPPSIRVIAACHVGDSGSFIPWINCEDFICVEFWCVRHDYSCTHTHTQIYIFVRSWQMAISPTHWKKKHLFFHFFLACKSISLVSQNQSHWDRLWAWCEVCVCVTAVVR